MGKSRGIGVVVLFFSSTSSWSPLLNPVSPGTNAICTWEIAALCLSFSSTLYGTSSIPMHLQSQTASKPKDDPCIFFRKVGRIHLPAAVQVLDHVGHAPPLASPPTQGLPSHLGHWRAFLFNWSSGQRSRLDMWLWGSLAQLRDLNHKIK